MANAYGPDYVRPVLNGPEHGRPPYGSLEAFEVAMRRQGLGEAEISRALALYPPSPAEPSTDNVAVPDYRRKRISKTRSSKKRRGKGR